MFTSLDNSNHRVQDDVYQRHLRSLFVFRFLNILQRWSSNINQFFLVEDNDMEISLGTTLKPEKSQSSEHGVIVG